MDKMDKIKKYVDRFFTTVKVNRKYDMSAMELFSLSKCAIGDDTLSVVNITFNFGYVKGYRAALAEMKKGGAAV